MDLTNIQMKCRAEKKEFVTIWSFKPPSCFHRRLVRTLINCSNFATFSEEHDLNHRKKKKNPHIKKIIKLRLVLFFLFVTYI